jgi:hypothetical protein
MSRLCTSGRPELIIVANCRVKMTMSRVETPLPKAGIPMAAFFSLDLERDHALLAQEPDDLVPVLELDLAALHLARRGAGRVHERRHGLPSVSR